MYMPYNRLAGFIAQATRAPLRGPVNQQEPCCVKTVHTGSPDHPSFALRHHILAVLLLLPLLLALLALALPPLRSPAIHLGVTLPALTLLLTLTVAHRRITLIPLTLAAAYLLIITLSALTALYLLFLLPLTALPAIVRFLLRSRSLVATMTIIAFYLLGALFPLSYTAHVVDDLFLRREDPNRTPTPLTINGNPYVHDTIAPPRFHAGYIRNRYLCEKELSREWNRKFSMDYYGPDSLGNPLRETLIDYLTSAGHRKDSAGLALLTYKDILLIQSGCRNAQLVGKSLLYKQIYAQIEWIDAYYSYGDPLPNTSDKEYANTLWTRIVSLLFPGPSCAGEKTDPSINHALWAAPLPAIVILIQRIGLTTTALTALLLIIITVALALLYRSPLPVEVLYTLSLSAVASPLLALPIPFTIMLILFAICITDYERSRRDKANQKSTKPADRNDS